MQDPEIPPEVEGEADGGAVGVRLIIAAVAADKVAIVTTQAAASTARPWITPTVRYWAVKTDIKVVAAFRQAVPRLIVRGMWDRFLRARTQLRAALLSSTICFSWPRSRRQHAR